MKAKDVGSQARGILPAASCTDRKLNEPMIFLLSKDILGAQMWVQEGKKAQHERPDTPSKDAKFYTITKEHPLFEALQLFSDSMLWDKQKWGDLHFAVRVVNELSIT